MRKELSTYLDAVRFGAALLVLFSHVGGSHWSKGFAWQFVPLGGFAVDIFFVLSGFVIAYVADEKERDLRTYAISRAARLYSVCLPVLIFAFLLANIGHALNPTGFDSGDLTLRAFLAGATFTNQLWFMNIEPANVGPYWSLGYEAAYYTLFAAALFTPSRWKYISVTLFALVVGPKILIMLPVWLAGVFAYRALKQIKLGQQTALILWLISILVLLLLALIEAKRGTAQVDTTAAFARPLWAWKSYMLDYAIGFTAAINFAAFHFSAGSWTKAAETISAPVTWVAGATFTLYLTHYPLGLFLLQTSPWPIGTWQQISMLIVGTIGFAFVFAEFTERKKHFWRRLIQSFVNRLSLKTSSRYST